LQTPFMTVWDNNWSPVPVLGNGVQMFQPTHAFFLDQNFYATNTNSYVVQYGLNDQLSDQLRGVYYFGPSFVRDFDRQGLPGDVTPVFNWDAVSPVTGTIFPVDVFEIELEKLKRKRVHAESEGPAVNLGPIHVLARRTVNGFDLSVARN